MFLAVGWVLFGEVTSCTPINWVLHPHSPQLPKMPLTQVEFHWAFTFYFCIHIPLELKYQCGVAYDCYMLFFNTKFDIYTESQSPGFKPGTDAIHLPYF